MRHVQFPMKGRASTGQKTSRDERLPGYRGGASSRGFSAEVASVKLCVKTISESKATLRGQFSGGQRVTATVANNAGRSL